MHKMRQRSLANSPIAGPSIAHEWPASPDLSVIEQSPHRSTFLAAAFLLALSLLELLLAIFTAQSVEQRMYAVLDD